MPLRFSHCSQLVNPYNIRPVSLGDCQNTISLHEIVRELYYNIHAHTHAAGQAIIQNGPAHLVGPTKPQEGNTTSLGQYYDIVISILSILASTVVALVVAPVVALVVPANRVDHKLHCGPR